MNAFPSSKNVLTDDFLAEDLLTLSEAAKLKKVSRQAIYDAIKAGRLACLHVMGRPAVRKADLLSWQIIGRRGGSPLTAEHKAKISQALKRRWAKRKSQSKS